MAKDSTVVTVVNPHGGMKPSGDSFLVVIYGDDLGKRNPLERPSVVIGRADDADIELDDESVSRNHAMVLNLGDQHIVKDLDSTNGTFVNDRRSAEVILRDGDLLKIGRTIFKFLAGLNVEAAYYEELYRLNTMDALTDVNNRRHVMVNLEKELSRSLRYGRSFALIMLDVDRFKDVNDQYGHLTGDAVLKQIAQRAKKTLREDDIIGRYGGEEFLLLAPETEKEAAGALANQILDEIRRAPFVFDGTEFQVTCSAGVATLNEYRSEYHIEKPDSELTPAEVIALVDSRLYEAKEAGRDRVVF